MIQEQKITITILSGNSPAPDQFRASITDTEGFGQEITSSGYEQLKAAVMSYIAANL